MKVGTKKVFLLSNQQKQRPKRATKLEVNYPLTLYTSFVCMAFKQVIHFHPLGKKQGSDLDTAGEDALPKVTKTQISVVKKKATIYHFCFFVINYFRKIFKAIYEISVGVKMALFVLLHSCATLDIAIFSAQCNLLPYRKLRSLSRNEVCTVVHQCPTQSECFLIFFFLFFLLPNTHWRMHNAC